MPTTETAPPFEIKKGANYTVQEAATWLRKEQQFVYKAIRDSRLAAKRVTPRSPYIITGEALLDYFENLPDA